LLADQAILYLSFFKDRLLTEPFILLALSSGVPIPLSFELGAPQLATNEATSGGLTDLELCLLDASTAFELYYESLVAFLDLGYLELLFLGLPPP